MVMGMFTVLQTPNYQTRVLLLTWRIALISTRIFGQAMSPSGRSLQNLVLPSDIDHGGLSYLEILVGLYGVFVGMP